VRKWEDGKVSGRGGEEGHGDGGWGDAGTGKETWMEYDKYDGLASLQFVFSATHAIDGEYIREWLVLRPFFPENLSSDSLVY
jgi:hypothetical protein